MSSMTCWQLNQMHPCILAILYTQQTTNQQQCPTASAARPRDLTSLDRRSIN
jgi:hypothetical protein